MNLDLKNLPKEINLLHQIIFDLVDQLTFLREQLAILKAKRFGKSSEKLNKQIEDLELCIEEIESSSALSTLVQANVEESSEGGASPQSKNQPKRQKLPDHLERTDVVLNPDPKCPSCDGEKFRTISEDISETLEYVPSSFKVIRHVRPPLCLCQL